MGQKYSVNANLDVDDFSHLELSAQKFNSGDEVYSLYVIILDFVTYAQLIVPKFLVDVSQPKLKNHLIGSLKSIWA